ncbi:MAG TPA: hypothetical protein VNQ90_10960 [Chthoniobacteraceae bacterium]|nr:hypothetical protein [Chthoniobacteraceae bacterium]
MRSLLYVGLISLAVLPPATAETKPPAEPKTPPAAKAAAKSPPPAAAEPTVAKAVAAKPAPPAAKPVTPKSYYSSEFEEPLVLQYLAPPGQPVKKGEIIAVFDCVAVVEALDANRAELAKEEKAISDAAEKIAAAEAAEVEAVQEGKEELRLLKVARERYLEGEAPLAELMLTIALHDAEAAYHQQEERFNARDKLLAEGFIQKVEYENEGIRFEKADLTRQAAKAKLANFTRFEKPLAIEQHSRKLKEKEAALAAAALKREKALDALRKEEAAAKKRHQSRLTKHRSLEALLEKTVIRAAEDGIFMPGDPTHPRQAVARGCSIDRGQVFGFTGR